MKAVIQRVKEASVSVGGKTVSGIGVGFLILLGIAEGDTEEQVQKMAKKVADLRVMADEGGKMNRSVKDVIGGDPTSPRLRGAGILVVSQFTLLADTSRGNRPSFVKAAKPERAKELYEFFVEELKGQGIPVKTGEFGAFMQVSLVNDGPVTIILEV